MKLRSSGRTLVLLMCVFTVAACGPSKKVVTKDDSADYKSARSLPPLKKPSRVLAPRPAEPIQAEPIQAEPIQAEPIQAEPIQAEPVNENLVAPTAQVAQAPQADTPLESIAARVISPNDDVARMQIEADFDSAWEFLGENIKNSDVTIFSRNKAAGRISIGCADIDAAPVVEQRGGWSFINRKKSEQMEYCALQAISSKGATVVTVLNRAGQEVSREYASLVFQRILNN